VNLPRAAVSILKVIDQTISPTSQSWLCCTAFLPSEPDHEQCNRIANWISLTTGLEQEIGVTESWEVPEFWEFNEGGYQKVCFFMLSCLISNLASTAEFRAWRPHHLAQQLFPYFPQEPVR
jgi:hypothetical protein